MACVAKDGAIQKTAAMPHCCILPTDDAGRIKILPKAYASEVLKHGTKEMADQGATDRIDQRDREKSKQANFRTLWQDISDMGTPFIQPIQREFTRGDELMHNIFDITMMEESENMASGLSNNITPPGQEFFALRAADRRLNKINRVRRYLAQATEQLHQALAGSNFLTQTDISLLMWLQFGTSCQWSEWTVKHGLNFRDYGIGMWQALENEAGIIDGIILTIPKTARQCVQEFGLENVGPSITKAYNNPETKHDIFNIVWTVQPRKEFDESKIDALNNPFESFYDAEDDQITIEEGGFPEFPFAVPRYSVIHNEVYGRGRGAVALRAQRTLNRAVKNFDEVGDKLAKPPLEVLESFDGDVDVTPNAQNFVTEMESIRPINLSAMGSYPVTKDWIEFRTTRIQNIYFKNTLEQISQLKGDRRNELQIRALLSEGFKRLTRPISRLYVEQYDVQVSRALRLLIRNGVIEEPPPELSGQPFKIDYTGPIALALQDQQSQALVQWVQTLAGMEELFPGIRDNVDSDVAARDLGESLGVKTDHITPIRKRTQIRQQRAELQQQQRQAELLETASKGYKQTREAAEEGSPAKQLQDAIA